MLVAVEVVRREGEGLAEEELEEEELLPDVEVR